MWTFLTVWSCIENLQCGIKNISTRLVAGTKQQQGGGGGRGAFLQLVEERLNMHRQ